MTFALRRPAFDNEADVLMIALASTAGAGVLHASVIGEHLEEYWLFGAFFIASTFLQLAWAGAALLYPSRLLLVLGVMGNGGIALVWLLSRTTGLPVGPEPWTREQVGWTDVVATALEVVAILVVWALLRTRRMPNRATLWSASRRARVVAVAIGVLITTLVVQGASRSASGACANHSDLASSPTGPLFPVDGHAMLVRTTPATRARPNERFGLVVGVFVNCAGEALRVTGIELGTTGEGATADGSFVMRLVTARPGYAVDLAMLRRATPAEGAMIAPTGNEPDLALVAEVRTRPSDETLPFLVSVVVVEYEVDGETYRAPFGSIARIEFDP